MQHRSIGDFVRHDFFRPRAAVAVVLISLAVATTADAQPLRPTGMYNLDPIYDTQINGIGPLGVVAGGAALSALAGRQVITVGLPAENASVPLFTLPDTVGGGPAFAGGFAPTVNGHILTGQTGAFLGTTFAGEVYLTPAVGGPTATHVVNGNYDATPLANGFAVSAGHGADDFNMSPGTYGGPFGDFLGSGLYALSTANGAFTGLDLLLDTGAYSGAVAADPVTGDIYFALGSDSATLSGSPNGYNDIWVIKAADIAAATGAATISAMDADYLCSIGTGFNDGINGLVFDPAGRLLVGLTDFTGAGIDRIMQFDVSRDNADDYAGALFGNVVEATSGSVRIRDFVLDGDTIRVTAVPEPACLCLLAGTVCMRRWWRKR